MIMMPPPRPEALRTAVTKDLDSHNTSLGEARAGVEAPFNVHISELGILITINMIINCVYPLLLLILKLLFRHV